VLPARLIAARILSEGAQAHSQLLGHEGNELLRRVLARPKTLTGMAQQAELDGEAEAVRRTAFGANEGQVVGAKDIVPCHLGAVHGDGEQQNNALQAKALRAAGCRRLFEESASGGRWDRPELHRMLDQLREGDTMVVWKLDRLSRSLKDVLLKALTSYTALFWKR